MRHMTDSYVTWHIHVCVTWLVNVCGMTHSCVTWPIHMWHASVIYGMTRSCVTWLIHMWHDSFMCYMTHTYFTWLIHMSHEPVTHESRTSNTWITNQQEDEVCLGSLYSLWDMSDSYMRHYSFIYDMTHSYVTWLIHMSHEPGIRCGMSGLALLTMSHGSFICETWLVQIWHDSSKRNMTHSYASRTRKKMQYVWARSTRRHISLVWHLCVTHTHQRCVDMTHTYEVWSGYTCDTHTHQMLRVDMTHTYEVWSAYTCDMATGNSNRGKINMKQKNKWCIRHFCSVTWHHHLNSDTTTINAYDITTIWIEEKSIWNRKKMMYTTFLLHWLTSYTLCMAPVCDTHTHTHTHHMSCVDMTHTCEVWSAYTVWHDYIQFKQNQM